MYRLGKINIMLLWNKNTRGIFITQSYVSMYVFMYVSMYLCMYVSMYLNLIDSRKDSQTNFISYILIH